MARTYGVISDLHSIDPRFVEPTIRLLKHEEVDALVLNGDLFGEKSGYDPQQYFATVLDAAGRSGLETFVLPGSHEVVSVFDPVLSHFTEKYGNLVNTLVERKVEKGDHDLVFLQGSDSQGGHAIGQGYILQDQHQTGIYENGESYMAMINAADLTELVTDPEKTLVFSHVPRRFSNSGVGVDMADFWKIEEEFNFQGHNYEVGSILPGPVGYDFEKDGFSVIHKNENAGNSALKKIYEELGITKNVTGHFHESVWRAHDQDCKPVEEGLFVPSLFYNASLMDDLKVGMVTVDGEKVAYENLDLKKYIKGVV